MAAGVNNDGSDRNRFLRKVQSTIDYVVRLCNSDVQNADTLDSVHLRLQSLKRDIERTGGVLLSDLEKNELLEIVEELAKDIDKHSKSDSEDVSFKATRERTGQVGAPKFEITKEQLEFLSKYGFTAPMMAEVLHTSESTIRRRLRQYAIALREGIHTVISSDDLDEKVKEIIGTNKRIGPNSIRVRLAMDNINVSRQTVRDSCHRVDPAGSALRSIERRNIQRRRYKVAGPNSLWHLDGNHKLIRIILHPNACDRDGVTFIAPDIEKVQWSTDLKHLPNTEIADVLIYLLKVAQWTDSRLKYYRNDKGYKLFQDHHINDVQMSKIASSDYFYVFAKCIRETSLSENPYTTWLILQGDGMIFSAGCTCVADDGTCKHCTALLFGIADFSERHVDRNTLVCTDEPCKWDQPRKVSVPKRIDDINTTHDGSKRKSEPNERSFKPSICPDTNYDSVESDILELCKNFNPNAVMLHLFDQTENEACKQSDNSIPTMLDITSECVKFGDEKDFLRELRLKMTPELICSIEEKTVQQSDCEEWYDQRLGRITASIVYSVCNFRDNNNENNYILKKIMSPRNSVNTAATQYGKEHEIIAKCLYSNDYMKNHIKARISDSGFTIFESIPYLGASPDGRVNCKCCGTGILEIKCTHSYKDLTPEEICEQAKTYFIFKDGNNNIKLKKNTSWFYQIQMQLGILGKDWCDFVFYTQKGFIVDRIMFDEDLFSYMKTKCVHFFDKYVLPALKKESLK